MSKSIKYINTGNDWYPEIPEHWNLKKIKYQTKFLNGYAFKADEYVTEDGIPIIRIGDVKNPIDLSNCIQVPKSYLEKTANWKVNRNDILLALTGATIGKSAIFDNDELALLNQRVGIIRPLEGVLNTYLKFIVNSDTFRKFVFLECDGGAQENIGKEEIGNYSIPLPSEKEQIEISNFLDQKTAEIDHLISKKQKLIKCLKEERIEIINQAVIGNLSHSIKKKPSGFDWVPTIPENWTTNKIKNVTKIFGRIGYRGYQTSDLVNEGEGAITLSPSNMKEFEMDFSKCTYLSWFKYNESPEIQIANGDILFVKTGSTYGKTSLVKNLPEKATINPQLLVFKEVKINSEFFYYVLLSQLIQAQVSISVIGGTIPTISQEKIGNYYLFVPPVDEQIEIVKMINQHLDYTSFAISKVEQEIELIKEYRTALINEVVTGKITLN